jgi:hypothetical protein
VITHEREYKNPFAAQDVASAPAPEPTNIEAPAAPAAAEAEPKAAEAPAAQASPPETPAQKPEIQILPPAEAARPAVRWESSSATRDARPGDRPDRGGGDSRPTFRADRRDERGEPRPEGRDFRRPQPQREPRQQFDQHPRPDQAFTPDRPTQEAKPASGGFFGWLKGLFGGKPAEAPVGREAGGERFQEGQRHRRRHRGGRGHGGEFHGGYGGERPAQGGEQEPRGGEHHGGRRRRRHRGGFGRDRGGDPRSEGHQGGGAI